MEDLTLKRTKNIWLVSFLAMIIAGTVIIVMKKGNIWWYLLLYLVVAPILAGAFAAVYATNAKTTIAPVATPNVNSGNIVSNAETTTETTTLTA